MAQANDEYYRGFFVGARYAFGMLRDYPEDQIGLRGADAEMFSVQWDLEWSDIPVWDHGYIDGIAAVISHLPIEEGTFSADTDYTPCINLGELLAGAI